MESFRVLLELPNIVGFVQNQTPNTFEKTKQERNIKENEPTLFYN